MMNGLGDSYFHGLSSHLEPAAGSFPPSSMSIGSSFSPYHGAPSLSPSLPYPSTMGSFPTSSSYMNPYLQMHGLVQQTQKRPRSEKKAIPDEQKDGKYFERRKRNNNAAKKSRDARKSREDEIAIRASFLEKENAILRAQVGTLREEASSLKHLLLQKRGRT
ncbi:albumin D box-binding protein [Mytilus galloprovincialis]|uniref:Albumin D box-binding protein n=1 Tax=Mytilus galloprovincialis TaxID=29158 RepID=A0A8B6ES90_MYTGA|nr:albumin D box-binding protein [Mytilus galloprovincialis]